MDFNRVLSKNEKLISEPLKKVLNDLDLKLYDFDYQAGTSTFRVFIYNQDTKTASLEDCVAVDKQLSAFFEECESLPENVTLEVSSPGVYRLLKKKFHFEMSLNEFIKVKLVSTIDGFKGKLIEGTLVEIDGETITIREGKNNNLYKINFNNMKSAQADYKF